MVETDTAVAVEVAPAGDRAIGAVMSAEPTTSPAGIVATSAGLLVVVAAPGVAAMTEAMVAVAAMTVAVVAATGTQCAFT